MRHLRNATGFGGVLVSDYTTRLTEHYRCVMTKTIIANNGKPSCIGSLPVSPIPTSDFGSPSLYFIM